MSYRDDVTETLGGAINVAPMTSDKSIWRLRDRVGFVFSISRFAREPIGRHERQPECDERGDGERERQRQREKE